MINVNFLLAYFGGCESDMLCRKPCVWISVFQALFEGDPRKNLPGPAKLFWRCYKSKPGYGSWDADCLVFHFLVEISSTAVIERSCEALFLSYVHVCPSGKNQRIRFSTWRRTRMGSLFLKGENSNEEIAISLLSNSHAVCQCLVWQQLLPGTREDCSGTWSVHGFSELCLVSKVHPSKMKVLNLSCMFWSEVVVCNAGHQIHIHIHKLRLLQWNFVTERLLVLWSSDLLSWYTFWSIVLLLRARTLLRLGQSVSLGRDDSVYGMWLTGRIKFPATCNDLWCNPVDACTPWC